MGLGGLDGVADGLALGDEEGVAEGCVWNGMKEGLISWWKNRIQFGSCKKLKEIKFGEQRMAQKYGSPTRKEKRMGLRWALPTEMQKARPRGLRWARKRDWHSAAKRAKPKAVCGMG